jgi:hypothetical protein
MHLLTHHYAVHKHQILRECFVSSLCYNINTGRSRIHVYSDCHDFLAMGEDMTLTRTQSRGITQQAKSLGQLVRPEELFMEANVWVSTGNSNHIEMDWTIDRTAAQDASVNCYRIYVHVYDTPRACDYVIATDRDSVMVFPDQQSRRNAVKFLITDNAVNYMHSPIREESESYYVEALQSWDSPKGSGIMKTFDIHFVDAGH